MINLNNGESRIQMSKDTITINGNTYPKPSKGNNITQVNEKIFINGYQFKNGKFKRTILSMWYYYF
jgi:methyl coenzyme M reductase subunit D